MHESQLIIDKFRLKLQIFILEEMRFCNSLPVKPLDKQSYKKYYLVWQFVMGGYWMKWRRNYWFLLSSLNSHTAYCRKWRENSFNSRFHQHFKKKRILNYSKTTTTTKRLVVLSNKANFQVKESSKIHWKHWLWIQYFLN